MYNPDDIWNTRLYRVYNTSCAFDNTYYRRVTIIFHLIFLYSMVTFRFDGTRASSLSPGANEPGIIFKKNMFVIVDGVWSSYTQDWCIKTNSNVGRVLLLLLMEFLLHNEILCRYTLLDRRRWSLYGTRFRYNAADCS